MSEDEQNEVVVREVEWPPPREDPPEEPTEPWARIVDLLEDERP